MGTENKNRELKVADKVTASNGAKLSKLQLIKKQEKKKKIIKYVTMAAVVAIIVAIIVSVVVVSYEKKLGNIVAGKSANYTITDDMVAYMMYSEYSNLASNYSSYLTTLGLDTSASLTSQNPSIMATYYLGYDYSITWFENFAQNAMSTLTQYVTIWEKANAEGKTTLTDDEKKSIDDTISSMKAYAKQNGITTNAFLSQYYTNGVTVDTIRKCAELEIIFSNYYNALIDSYEFTAEEKEKYCNDNKSSFYTYDIISYDFEAEVLEDTEEDYEAKNKASLEEAKAKADDFKSKVTDFDSFVALINEIERAANSVVADDATDEQKAAAEEAKTKDYSESHISKEKAYSDSTVVGKWVAEDGRKAGDVEVLFDEDASTYTVCYLITALHRDETTVRDVRHILINCDDVEDEDELAEAKAKVESILAEYEAGEKTAEAFGALAEKYSEDTGSNTNGGLYEDVAPGEMVTAFNDWLFDEARTVGETGIVVTDYGVHLMYYAGEGENKAWENDAISGLKTEKYSSDLEAYAAEYPIAWNSDAILQLAK